MGICYNTRKIFETHIIFYPVYTKGCFVLHISKKKKKVPHELNLQMIVIFTIFTSILLFFYSTTSINLTYPEGFNAEVN